MLSFSNVECIISFVFLEYQPKGQPKNPAAVPTKTANPTFLQHNQSDNISYIDVNSKISYLKLRYSLKGNVIHDQDNTNGTGTLDQTVSETTTSKMRSGVSHYHFQNFSNRGGPLLTYNN